MNLIEKSFKQIKNGFEHTLKFECEKRLFIAVVVETNEETYVKETFYQIPKGNLISIDIPKYFGAYRSDVYTFIYDNIQRGFSAK